MVGEREEDQLRLQKLLVKIRHIKEKMFQITEKKKKNKEGKKTNTLKKENSAPKLDCENQLHLIHIC